MYCTIQLWFIHPAIHMFAEISKKWCWFQKKVLLNQNIFYSLATGFKFCNWRYFVLGLPPCVKLSFYTKIEYDRTLDIAICCNVWQEVVRYDPALTCPIAFSGRQRRLLLPLYKPKNTCLCKMYPENLLWSRLGMPDTPSIYFRIFSLSINS